jgi:hypothetical protein
MGLSSVSAVAGCARFGVGSVWSGVMDDLTEDLKDIAIGLSTMIAAVTGCRLILLALKYGDGCGTSGSGFDSVITSGGGIRRSVAGVAGSGLSVSKTVSMGLGGCDFSPSPGAAGILRPTSPDPPLRTRNHRFAQ